MTDRFDELERRVAALENTLAAGTTPAPAERPRTPDPETFWVLEGLHDRLPAGTGAVVFAGVVDLPGDGGHWEWQEQHSDGALLDTDWEGAGTALAALASPVRMRLLREVLGGSGTAAELAGLEGLGTSGQVYHHLRQLTAAGWLRNASRGRYAVPPERIVPLLAIVAAANR